MALPPKSLILFLACVMGLLNGYDVVNLPSIPGSQAVQSRVERVTDRYTHRAACAARQVRVLSAPGEANEDRLQAVERDCEGVPGT
jgi:hypothetical protein